VQRFSVLPSLILKALNWAWMFLNLLEQAVTRRNLFCFHGHR